MNKAYLILMIVVFKSLSSYCQERWEGGIRIIPQATTFRYTQGVGPLIDFLKVSAPYDFRIRSAQGIGVTYNPNRHIHVGGDLTYSLQGGGYKKRKTNLNYLSLPLWLGYHASLKRKVIFTVQSGIEISYLSKNEISNRGTGENQKIRAGIKLRYTSIYRSKIQSVVLLAYHTTLYLY